MYIKLCVPLVFSVNRALSTTLSDAIGWMSYHHQRESKNRFWRIYKPKKDLATKRQTLLKEWIKTPTCYKIWGLNWLSCVWYKQENNRCSIWYRISLCQTLYWKKNSQVLHHYMPNVSSWANAISSLQVTEIFGV